MRCEHKLKGDWQTRDVLLNNSRLKPGPSLKIFNHSPDGFNWGYGGSGPAQLALAVLLRLFGKYFAVSHYQDFKWQVIAILPQSDFEVTFFYDDENQNFGIL